MYRAMSADCICTRLVAELWREPMWLTVALYPGPSLQGTAKPALWPRICHFGNVLRLRRVCMFELVA